MPSCRALIVSTGQGLADLRQQGLHTRKLQLRFQRLSNPGQVQLWINTVHVTMQVEARCTPRAPLPTPAAGSLPLPTGLPALKAAFEPRTIEDLNAVQPEGTPPLATQPEPKAPVGITHSAVACGPMYLCTRIYLPRTGPSMGICALLIPGCLCEAALILFAAAHHVLAVHGQPTARGLSMGVSNFWLALSRCRRRVSCTQSPLSR